MLRGYFCCSVSRTGSGVPSAYACVIGVDASVYKELACAASL